MARDLRLVDFEQSLQAVDGNSSSYDVRTFPGVAPILVRRDQGVIIVTQSGRAVAWQSLFVPPAPLFTLIGEPQVTRRRLPDAEQWETSWSYTMAAAAGDTIDFIAAAKWPTSPTFTAVS